MSVLKDGSTVNSDGIDETPSFPALSSPAPPAPENFYLLLSRILYYKYSRNLGGRVKSEEKKRKRLQPHISLWFKAEGNRAIPEVFQTELTLLGPVLPTWNSQSLTALSFKLLNHFNKWCIPTCWWEITVIPCFNHHFLASHWEVICCPLSSTEAMLILPRKTWDWASQPWRSLYILAQTLGPLQKMFFVPERPQRYCYFLYPS